MSILARVTDMKAVIFLMLKTGLVLATAFVTGCSPHTAQKEMKPLVSGNDSYSILYDGIKPQDMWWEEFGDPALSLLIRESLTANLTLKQMYAGIEQAIAADKQAASFMYPELSAGVSGKREWDGNNDAGTTFNMFLNLSWEADLWKRVSSSQRAALHDIFAAHEDLEATALLMSAAVAETYFQILEQRRQLSLLEQQIHVGETFLELTELRFGYGEASVVDVYQQRQLLASTRSQIPVVKSRLRALGNRLHVQLGRAPGDLSLAIAEDFPELPELPDTGVPADLLQKRPDLRRIYNELSSIDYRIAQAVADRFPKLQLDGSMVFTDGFSAEDRLMSLLLQAITPLIDWDRRSAEVEKREAMFKERLARYSEAYLVAIEEVENALWREAYHLKLLHALEEQLNIARSNLDETRNRYQQGLTDYLPVLTALQSLQGLERDILAGRRQLISIRILLYRSLGGSRLMSSAESVTYLNSHISEGVVQ